MRQIGNPEEEANGVQDVGFPGAIQSRDGVESGIESLDHRSLSIRLEAVNDDGFDIHFVALDTPPLAMEHLALPHFF